VKSRTTFTYAQATDPDGFWTSRKDWLKDDVHGIDKDVETTRTRDVYGNVASVTDARTHTTTTAYDGDGTCPSDPDATSTHTFPCRVTNAKGHTSTSVYDAALGLATSIRRVTRTTAWVAC
jgi:YD repeat-containing protein